MHIWVVWGVVLCLLGIIAALLLLMFVPSNSNDHNSTDLEN